MTLPILHAAYRTRMVLVRILATVRPRLISLLVPGLQIKGRVSIGPGVRITCAPGGSIVLAGTRLEPGVVLDASPGAHLFIGQAKVSHRCVIAARNSITIEDAVLIADHVSIRDHDHLTDHDLGVRPDSWTTDPIVIHQGAWLASKCTLIMGVTVGRNAVVAAGAVVTRDVPANDTVGGVPARSLRRDGPPKSLA